MLNDPHFKVLKYYPNASDVFPNVVFSGGVVISYYNNHKKFDPIESFSIFPEVNSILKKIRKIGLNSIDKIMYGQGSYKYTNKMHEDFPKIKYFKGDDGKNKGILSKGHDYDIATSALINLNSIIFFNEKPKDNHEYIKIIGRKNNKRGSSYIRKEYVCNHPNLNKYKVILSKADGAAGTLGKPVPARIIGVPTAIGPKYGHTQTFISIGCFENESEAKKLEKYIKTKFCRVLIGTLKVTQDNPPAKWKNVPLQDFTDNSDIDWSKSIPEIDQQLYRKYGLSDEEIDFIETHVEEMK